MPYRIPTETYDRSEVALRNLCHPPMKSIETLLERVASGEPISWNDRQWARDILAQLNRDKLILEKRGLSTSLPIGGAE